MRKTPSLTRYIIGAMILGAIVGAICHNQVQDSAKLASIAGYLSIGTEVFLRLIKMIVAPLVFATLVPGIAKMGDVGAVGRVGLKAMSWFVGASLVSLVLGLVLANWLQPGANTNFPLPEVTASVSLSTNAFSLKDFITHLVPRSAAEAMAQNEILQVVVFSIFCGIALAALEERGKMLVQVVDQLGMMMLKITEAVMRFSPIAVFTAIASIIATKGLGILMTFAKFIGMFYLGLATLWSVLILVGFIFLGRRIFSLIKMIRAPFLLSFMTASSEAAFPQMLTALDKFGVSRRISSFVLPLGYSFNLDGTMVYCTFTILFIAQAYGIALPIETQITMLLMLMVTSKGIAGVPRASLVVIAATLAHFNLPEAGLLMIMAIDTFMDMGRSATNAVGNSIACAVVAKWEGALDASRTNAPETETELVARREAGGTSPSPGVST
ncbi:dicarboxylate symporter family protein [Burkholderia ambifaria AMMD]|uniref:Sodium:dicarboxylate symporter n=1 Tax=Burkholderia ambifaria (strain ATCC BAA-244 / DSM 16087 / CCUG 44356 / LMG 19182 / AMMD) TaxID=339670 RepID=Q0B1K2_BURCM|nr:dicarboxylate/amino acid:cation symporter [Burkholderia ambifaria]ABI91971.1 sodium:dicarboxylate symporter [Burkholderia ambifaria AMMD]AJY26144.1 dicarboxylate symporter family protein [Burkholderia ambifaria AMMD]MBR7932613.1 dicarboxylate/amino acid:cation symporter [Burkholderia ambifaria]NHL70847.1 dicarboxylate/amino acid:cation symporter [Burkholderia ambifaria]PEH70193.1 dicarboxylate/amino acid:cation symporter [Burkholderia ambifaria]